MVISFEYLPAERRLTVFDAFQFEFNEIGCNVSELDRFSLGFSAYLSQIDFFESILFALICPNLNNFPKHVRISPNLAEFAQICSNLSESIVTYTTLSEQIGNDKFDLFKMQKRKTAICQSIIDKPKRLNDNVNASPIIERLNTSRVHPHSAASSLFKLFFHQNFNFRIFQERRKRKKRIINNKAG